MSNFRQKVNTFRRPLRKRVEKEEEDENQEQEQEDERYMDLEKAKEIADKQRKALIKQQKGELKNKPAKDDDEEDLEDDELVAFARTRRSQGNDDDEEEGKPATFDDQQLLDILNEMKLDLPWTETLAVTTENPSKLRNVNDDKEREAHFYALTLAAAKQAHKQLEAANIPFRRPADYFAEMMKSDDQMKKIKASLMDQKKRIESSEEKKKLREMKKYGKKVQQAKVEERKKAAKQAVDTVSKWRKARLKGQGDEEVPISFDDKKSSGSGRIPPKKTISKKRQAKEEKYAPKKRRDKKNSSESSSDMRGFSVKGNKSFANSLSKQRQFGPQKGIKRGAAKRPGKQNRRQGKK